MDGNEKLVTDYDAILNDDSINCVVELMGGVTDAKDVSGPRRMGSLSFVVVASLSVKCHP